MSLKHAFTDLIADDPALPTFVRPSNWNEEHVFPGAGAGEVVFVDGAGQAATSADFTFDAGTLGVSGEIRAYFWHPDDDNYDFGAITPGGFLRNQIGTGTAQTFMSIGLSQDTPTAGSVVTYQNGNGGWGMGSSADTAPNAWYPFSDNAQDLGGVTATVGSDFRLRTGYFGTSVVSPLYVAGATPGITTTVTTASLVGKTITITGGIITGFA